MPSGVRVGVADCTMSYTINIVYLILQCESLFDFLLSVLVRRVHLTQFCIWICLANRLSDTCLDYSGSKYD